MDPGAGIGPWIEAARAKAIEIARDQDMINAWLRHGGTWFVGVNCLPNDTDGTISKIPFPNGLNRMVRDRFSFDEWDLAQISINYPGYPKQDPQESDAAARFRRNRDAAHVDGLLPNGPEKRRHLEEAHAFVLGLPLTQADDTASPMVIWEGSHKIMADAFQSVLRDTPPQDWPNVDLTEVYQTTRKHCFETCRRRIVHVPVGQGYIIHRAALHGVAPWAETAKADPDGRIIAYFRPDLRGGVANWFDA